MSDGKPSLHHAKSKPGDWSATFCVRPDDIAPSRISSHGDASRQSFIQPPEAEKQQSFNDRTIAVKLPFEVVKGQIPKNLLDRLSRDFSDEEVEQIYARCGRSLAPRITAPDQPAVLFVLGPSAVGKSYITDASAAQLFGSAHNAVILDGEFFREWHAGWTEVVLHGMKQHKLHQDAWSIFKDVKVPKKGTNGCEDGTTVGISTALKQRILVGAIRDRQNLIVPSCANQPERLAQEMATLQKAGYIMHAVCLWAPLSETRQRGEPRSVREGKRWDPSSYPVSTKTVLSVAEQWIADMQANGAASSYHSIALWDNTVFPAREVPLDEFKTLAMMSNEEADQHAWQCKKPKHGAAAWGRLRAAHSISMALKPKNNSQGSQTEVSMAKGRRGRGGLNEIKGGGTSLFGALTSGSGAQSGEALREQRVKGRREGALGAFLAASLLWGAACVTLAMLLVERT